jgi:hypothetical protein
VCACNDPPAKPGAFRLLAPQRGLIATGTKPKTRRRIKACSPEPLRGGRQYPHRLRNLSERHLPGSVKLLLPPRQSRGVSYRTRKDIDPAMKCQKSPGLKHAPAYCVGQMHMLLPASTGANELACLWWHALGGLTMAGASIVLTKSKAHSRILGC